MEVVINESEIEFIWDQHSRAGEFIRVSIEARLLLYEYGFNGGISEYINKGLISSFLHDRHLLEWENYIINTSGMKPTRIFSKDLRYILGNVIEMRRDNPILIRVVKDLGVRSHEYIDDKFVIKTIPDDVDWKIDICNYKEVLFIKEKDDEWKEYKG